MIQGGVCPEDQGQSLSHPGKECRVKQLPGTGPEAAHPSPPASAAQKRFPCGIRVPELRDSEKIPGGQGGNEAKARRW